MTAPLETRNGITLPAFEWLGDDDRRHAPDGWDPWDDAAPIAGRSPWPISRSCSTSRRAIRTSGTRRLSSIGLLVIHTTEGATAAGAASWFESAACRGSAHLVVDGIECYRTLPPSAIPWAAPGCNGRGWHLEIAGFARWKRDGWLDRDLLLDRAAYKLAWHSRAFHVPLVRLTHAQLAGGRARGVVTNADATAVFGGSHTDPGAGFPVDILLGRAKRYLSKL